MLCTAHLTCKLCFCVIQGTLSPIPYELQAPACLPAGGPKPSREQQQQPPPPPLGNSRDARFSSVAPHQLPESASLGWAPASPSDPPLPPLAERFAPAGGANASGGAAEAADAPASLQSQPHPTGNGTVPRPGSTAAAFPVQLIGERSQLALTARQSLHKHPCVKSHMQVDMPSRTRIAICL